MKDTETLITSLTKEPGVQKIRLTPIRLFVLWTMALSTYVVVIFILGILKLRPDIASVLMQGLYASEIISLILLILTTLLSAALISFPEYGSIRYWAWPPALSFIFFVLSLFLSWFKEGPSVLPPHDDMKCLSCILILSVFPAVVMFYYIRRMATVRPDRAGMLSIICAFSVGALILRLSEQTDAMNHIIFVHYTPMLAMGAIGLWLGSRLLKW